MKYVVTAPPGGLGHFLARIVSGEYNFTVTSAGSYHSLKKEYSSQTTQIDEFDNIIHDTDQKVICLHNFDNRNLSTSFADRIIVNIIIDDNYEVYLNNFFRKAVQSSDSYCAKYLQESQKRFPTSDNYLREEFFFMYQSIVNHEILWLPQQPVGINLLFSSFYKKKLFIDGLLKVPGLSLDHYEEIWNHFITAQQPIINRVELYQPICDQLIQGKTPIIPEYFDNIDFGIMCGMIFVQTGLDKLNLNNNHWL